MTGPLSTGTYQQSVERGMQRSFAILVVLLLISGTGSVLSPAAGAPAPVVVMSIVFAGFLLVIAVRSWQARLTAHDGTVASIVATANTLAYLVLGQEALPMATRSNSLVVATLLVAGFHQRRRAWLICSGLAAVHFWVSLSVDGPMGAVESLWPLIAAPVAAAVVTRVLRSASLRADQSEQALQAAKVRAADAVARRAAHRHFQRTLHDDVASALRAVATTGLDIAEVRQACSVAVTRATESPAEPADGTAELWAGLADLPIPAGTQRVMARGDAIRIPADVAKAVVAAARQALANVERHARAKTVTISVEGDEKGFVVRVRDDGIGFRPQDVKQTSVGLRDSVNQRLADVGGMAEVDTAPGKGTTIALRWAPTAAGLPASDVDRHLRRGLRAALDDIRPPLAAVCLPYLLSMVIPVVRHLHATPLMPWVAGWYGSLIVGTTLLILAAHRPVIRWAAPLAAVWTVAGAVWALQVIPADSLTNYASWPIGAIGPMLVVLVTVQPPWIAVGALLIQEIVLNAMVVDGSFVVESYLDVLPAAVSSLLCLAMGFVIISTIARLGDVVLAANAGRTRIAVTAAARDGRMSLHARRIADIGQEILPFLRGIATGGPIDDAVRERARLLEWTARDELHIPGVLDLPARKRLENARRAGCVVTIQADTDTFNPPQAVRTLLDSALSTESAPQEVILSLHPAGDEVLISLVCLPGDAVRSAVLRAALPASAKVDDDDADATCVELSVPAE
ncbi:signal transduction histidine kinase [Kibdelosporangium banguiense]|uniref:Signal transduction histidine kinase n=1 Tax=Kibdelosporangium banguiense TaxID=1365924 RepID=A0ABS4TKK1_9PSEU|nr:ATP-binding protein [Kibdelosporangium banguiense]MBP2324854.1 signal transduction histidine kinase [Kibdelosporangium banguiense]